jgi:hypothetical protein
MITCATLKVGDRVRRCHPWDGSSRAGTPVGAVLTITRVFEGEPFNLCKLLDGKTEFEFLLFKEPFEVQFESNALADKLAS